MKKLVIAVLMVVSIAGCNSEEKAQQEQERQAMLVKLDSLSAENDKNLKAMHILEQVTIYMDSIEANRKWIEVEIEEGVSQDDFVARIQNINDYVQKAERMIADLEKTRTVYASQVKRLKNELELSHKEIAVLQQALETVKSENAELVTKVQVQNAEISAKAQELIKMNQELLLIEEKIQQLMLAANMTEAEAYYARGEATEEAANRTKLAAKKKRETLKEALALYEKSQQMGYEKATEKVNELKTRIKG